MTPDYRAICAELLAAIQLYTQLNPAASDMSAFELTEKLMDAMAATVAALTEPVAEPGEVAELVEWLRRICFDVAPRDADTITRAADLLAQRYPTPVPVSERLPGPEDCTAQGWCWVFYRGFATWTLESPLGQDGKHTGYTHWLPANALPTPEAKP